LRALLIICFVFIGLSMMAGEGNFHGSKIHRAVAYIG